MTAQRWLAFPFFASFAAAGFAACTGGTSTGSSGSIGGAGGASASSSSASGHVTSSGSSMFDAGPLTCKGDYTNIDGGECDLLAQNCGPGRTCRPGTKGGVPSTVCFDTPGIKSEGDFCTLNSECRGGLQCIAGRCAPFCCPSSGQPCKGGVCGFTVQYGNGATVRACRYSQQCQLLLPDACPPGFDCHIDDSFGLATCGARSNNPKNEYEECGFPNDCATMQQCISAVDAFARCYSLCWLKGPDSTKPKGLGGCDPGETCVGEGFNVPDLGICIPQNGLPDGGKVDSGAPDSGMMDAADEG